MLFSFILPFLYSLLVGCAWSAVFHKRFSSSLAPAFLSHILIVFLSGLLFGRLSLGVYGGIALACVMLIWALAKNGDRRALADRLHEQVNGGLPLFALLYVFCFLANADKRFLAFDEFSHWGFFLKESLRLDAFYCVSPLDFAHKDYVPAITLFETIWCRLCGGFTEADAYRAIQVFMFSMLMPVLESFRPRAGAENGAGDPLPARAKAMLPRLCALALLMMLPLIFQTGNGFMFYHSIYCDIPVGILFFYSLYEAYREPESLRYQIFLLTLALSVLVLSKMTAMALMPLVIGFFTLKLLFAPESPTAGKAYFGLLPMLLVPLSLWAAFNRFVDRYVENTGDIQSYDGMKLSSVAEVFTDPADSAIPYLGEVRELYLDRLLHGDVLLRGSYALVLILVVLAFFVLAVMAGRGTNRRKLILAGVWTLGSGLTYAVLMYFLYATAFSEYEALQLTNFERYMDSFLISALFLLAAAFCESEIWKRRRRLLPLLVLALTLDLVLLHPSAFKQALPGRLSKDGERAAIYLEAASLVDATPEDARIYLLRRADNGSFMWRERFYCSPRTIDWGSIGPPVTDFDIWSEDLSGEEFVDKLCAYDYILFFGVDDAFLEQYSSVFDGLPTDPDRQLFKISKTGSGIRLD